MYDFFPPKFRQVDRPFKAHLPALPRRFNHTTPSEVNQAHQRSCIGKAGTGYDQGPRRWPTLAKWVRKLLLGWWGKNEEFC